MKSSWRGTLILAIALVTFLALYLMFGSLGYGPTTTSAEAKFAQAASATEVGVAPVGRTAMEFTGRIDQNGPNFRIYGYVTYLYGLPPGLLFTQPVTHSEVTARITLSGTATIAEHTVISNVFHIDADGTLKFYFDEDHGASFDDLDSFGRGVAIGSGNMRLQNVLTVIGPNTGITNGQGEIIHTEVISFEVSGGQYKLGRPGMIERVSFSGGGVRFTPVPPVAIIAIGGASTVAGFDTFVPLTKK